MELETVNEPKIKESKRRGKEKTLKGSHWQEQIHSKNKLQEEEICRAIERAEGERRKAKHK